MASSQSFSRIQRRISLSPEPQSPLDRGEPLKMMAMRLAPFSGYFIFASMVCKNTSAPSFTRGIPAW
jgi:hypothetical protein